MRLPSSWMAHLAMSRSNDPVAGLIMLTSWRISSFDISSRETVAARRKGPNRPDLFSCSNNSSRSTSLDKVSAIIILKLLRHWSSLPISMSRSVLKTSGVGAPVGLHRSVHSTTDLSPTSWVWRAPFSPKLASTAEVHCIFETWLRTLLMSANVAPTTAFVEDPLFITSSYRPWMTPRRNWTVCSEIMELKWDCAELSIKWVAATWEVRVSVSSCAEEAQMWERNVKACIWTRQNKLWASLEWVCWEYKSSPPSLYLFPPHFGWSSDCSLRSLTKGHSLANHCTVDEERVLWHRINQNGAMQQRGPVN